MPKYLIKTISQHQMAYYVEADNVDQAEQFVLSGDIIQEFGQKYIGEQILESEDVTVNTARVIEQFDKMNDYLKDSWSDEEKLNQIMIVNS